MKNREGQNSRTEIKLDLLLGKSIKWPWGIIPSQSKPFWHSLARNEQKLKNSKIRQREDRRTDRLDERKLQKAPLETPSRLQIAFTCQLERGHRSSLSNLGKPCFADQSKTCHLLRTLRGSPQDYIIPEDYETSFPRTALQRPAQFIRGVLGSWK